MVKPRIRVSRRFVASHEIVETDVTERLCRGRAAPASRANARRSGPASACARHASMIVVVALRSTGIGAPARFVDQFTPRPTRSLVPTAKLLLLPSNTLALLQRVTAPSDLLAVRHTSLKTSARWPALAGAKYPTRRAFNPLPEPDVHGVDRQDNIGPRTVALDSCSITHRPKHRGYDTHF